MSNLLGFPWCGCFSGFKASVLWLLELFGWEFVSRLVHFYFTFPFSAFEESRVRHLADGRAAGLSLRCYSGSILDCCLHLLLF